MIEQKTKYVSIPQGLASVAVQSNRDLKSYAVFYQLKSLYVGGIIRDYRQKTIQIATTFGYSERKLRTYIGLLRDMGLLEVVNRRDLVLRASKFVSKTLGVSKKKFWRVPAAQVSSLEDILRVLALEEKMQQQAYRLESKLVNSEISSRVGIQKPTSLQPARLRMLRKAIVQDYGKLLQEKQQRYTETIANLQSKTPTKDSIFPWATLSRQGIATVLNRKSKATGHKYAKRFAKLGFIQDTRNTVFIGDFSYEEYTEMQETVLGNDFSYQFVHGEVHKVLPNTITVNRGNMLFV